MFSAPNAEGLEWAAGPGSNYSQRLFCKETGLPFGRWRQQARLVLVLARIAVGEKIIDVVIELGYESPNAFTSMFKKQFGKTSSQFFK